MSESEINTTIKLLESENINFNDYSLRDKLNQNKSIIKYILIKNLENKEYLNDFEECYNNLINKKYSTKLNILKKNIEFAIYCLKKNGEMLNHFGSSLIYLFEDTNNEHLLKKVINQTKDNKNVFIPCFEDTELKYNFLKALRYPKTDTIKESQFESNNIMKMLIIDDSVSIIEKHAFYNCSNLLFVYIPNSIQVIDKTSFSCCVNLMYLYIPIRFKEHIKDIFSDSFIEIKNITYII